MADAFRLQSGAPDRILLQDGSGVLLLQSDIATDVFIVGIQKIEQGVVASTAAGMGGVLQE